MGQIRFRATGQGDNTDADQQPEQGVQRIVQPEFSTGRARCAIIPCDEFSCPIKFTNRDTINWTFRGKNGTMGLEHKEVHYGRINLYESWRLLYPRSDT